MTQHTPGPWDATGSSVFAGSLPIAHTFLNPGIDVDHANARLIAAAPDLLELLDEAYDRFTDNDMQPANTKLRAWLTRAEAIFDRLRATGENLQKTT